MAITLILFTAALLAPASVRGEDRLYDLRAVNTEIADVLNALALQSGENIVVAAEVQKPITVQLKQVTFENAMEYIVHLHGYDYRKEGSAYLVSTPDKLKMAYPEDQPEPEPLVTELYTVKYLSAKNLQETLTKLLPGVTTTVGPDLMVPILGSASTGTSTSGGQMSSLGAGSSTSESGSANTNLHRTSLSRTLILRGPDNLVQDALSLAKRLDTPRPQVRIEAMILEISADPTEELGVQWSWKPLTLNEQSAPGIIKFGKFTRSTVSFTDIVSALIDSKKGRLLARPNLCVLDCERASMLIGDRLLYPKVVSYTDAGNPLYDKEEVQVGISLQVVPRIGDDGFITLTIYPQVSTVTKLQQIGGVTYPQISTREAQTTVRVRTGEQIAIGGLFKEEEILNMSKVPFLADLPILGELFKYKRTEKHKSEIVIIITPEILSESPSEENTP